FIESALNANLGVLCVTPTWATNTRRMQEHIVSLAALSDAIPIRKDQLFFVRGVSYGCALSLIWLLSSRGSPRRVAWITPCSEQQLSYAGTRMNLRVVHDGTEPHWTTKAPVWIQTLEADPIVPHIGSVFLESTPHVRLSKLHSSDH